MDFIPDRTVEELWPAFAGLDFAPLGRAEATFFENIFAAYDREDCNFVWQQAQRASIGSIWRAEIDRLDAKEAVEEAEKRQGAKYGWQQGHHIVLRPRGARSSSRRKRIRLGESRTKRSKWGWSSESANTQRYQKHISYLIRLQGARRILAGHAPFTS